MNASGSSDSVGWLTPGSGFLVRDLNNNGIIDNGSELFGTATTLTNGSKAQDGFAALQSLDSNNDGVISSKDSAWNGLKLWVDSNGDGISQSTELYSLQSLDITELNLNATQTAISSNGNWTLLDSTYTKSDGTIHEMADVYFENDGTAVNIASLASVQTMALTTTAIAALTTDQVYMLSTEAISVLTPDQLHALTMADINALSPAQVHVLSTEQIHALTPDQVASITTVDIAVLSQNQVMALHNSALTGLGSIDSFTPPEFRTLIQANFADSVAGTTLLTGGAPQSTDLAGAGDWRPAVTMMAYGNTELQPYSNGPAPALIPGIVPTPTKHILS